MNYKNILACFAVAFALFMTPMAALAVPDVFFDGDLSSVNFDVRMPVDGKIVSVYKEVVQQVSTPNTSMYAYESTNNADISIMANVADRVFLLASGDMLVPCDCNKGAGQLVSNPMGIIILSGDLTFSPSLGEFTGGSGTAVLFVFTAEMKSAVIVDQGTGLVTKGAAKLKVYPGQVEVVNVDATGGPVVVDSLVGTGEPAYLKIKLPTIKFWEVLPPV